MDSGSIQPSTSYFPPAPAKRKRLPTWAIVTISIAGVLVVCCVGLTIFASAPMGQKLAANTTATANIQNINATATASTHLYLTPTGITIPTVIPANAVAKTPTSTVLVMNTPTKTPKPTTAPIHIAPTPTQIRIVPTSTRAIPTPTPKPRPTATPTPKYAAINGNPYDINFSCCTLIYSNHLPANVCNWFNCIANFFNGSGYMNECDDGTYSMSGGIRGDCSHHKGEGPAVYLP